MCGSRARDVCGSRARDVCVGTPQGRAQREEERVRGEGKGCVGSRARDAQGSKALKGEVVQGMRVRTPREEEVK